MITAILFGLFTVWLVTSVSGSVHYYCTRRQVHLRRSRRPRPKPSLMSLKSNSTTATTTALLDDDELHDNKQTPTVYKVIPDAHNRSVLNVNDADGNTPYRFVKSQFPQVTNNRRYNHQYYLDSVEDLRRIASVSNATIGKGGMVEILREPARHIDTSFYNYVFTHLQTFTKDKMVYLDSDEMRPKAGDKITVAFKLQKRTFEFTLDQGSFQYLPLGDLLNQHDKKVGHVSQHSGTIAVAIDTTQLDACVALCTALLVMTRQ